MDKLHDLQNPNNILGYCGYCHNAIYVGDPYTTAKDGIYHPECFQIKGTYFDPLEVEDE